ncbi:sperm mitochondrial-associated cysteine-rich protein [Sphaeramia orbicularis]|uniref:sperm mitochondrial-associated cysteine-rich protein n=1 Tax=Sphaeramia orbicularis TaxID=375764 RepID=UPI0011809365|nr:uncharaterized LOC112694756 homolog [Sphaeramia orbicularis]XP_029996740.1 uncharaterized LOC112694756 homolog [Sphaeramia orbicularis]
MEVLSIWQLSVPLPAIMLITVTLYMIVVGIGLWIRFCLKDRCSFSCGDCCPDVSVSEQCYKMAETCDCRTPSLRSCLVDTCPSPSACPTPSCATLDCACTCHPPECDSCNCLCFEIRIK